mmetsp:Transcript_15438/g.18893  ORF Transcript_15438/g.18893 Transcript_15438/m.18893 type:complete len:421 (+) Transcript_15438:29-1291(+)
MIPNLFILNGTGDVLIEKHFGGNTKRYVCDLFWEEVSKYEHQKEVPPVLTKDNFYLINIRKNSLFFLTAIQQDTPPLLVFEMFHRIIEIFKTYFKDKKLDESMRENFSVIYQLLDEIIIGGFPHTIELNQLTDMIGVPSISSNFKNLASGQFSVKGTLPTAFHNKKTPWRKMDCKYVTNEIKIDIIEAIDAIIQFYPTKEQIVTSTINGTLECVSKLSGMPDLSLNFNNTSRTITRMQLHRCVRISRWQKDKMISFVPPNGKFTLARYTLPNAGRIPLTVQPIINLGNKGSNTVKITLLNDKRNDKYIDKILLEVPFPKETLSFTVTANYGKVTQDQITKTIKWQVGRYPKDKTPVLEGTVSMPNDYNGNAKPTVRIGFEIKGLSISNLKVDSLAVHNCNYKPFKGVRHITKAGVFLIRS